MRKVLSIPFNNSCTHDKTPSIIISIIDSGRFLPISSGKLFIDFQEVSPSINKFNLTFQSTKELSLGTHFASSDVFDNNNRFYHYEWCFTIEEKLINLNFYYGVPHAHTNLSDGRGTPMEAYEFARNQGLDFLIITDHLGGLLHSKNMSHRNLQLGDKNLSKWQLLMQSSNSINDMYSDFIALTGFEMNIEDHGHMCILNSLDIPYKKKLTLKELYKWINCEENIVVAINHAKQAFPKSCIYNELDSFINLWEVGNGAPPYPYRQFDRLFFASLDRGWHLGSINGQDNHLANWGIPDNLSVILSNTLSKEDIFNALKNRRVYSSETRTLKLLFYANDFFMGSIINCEKSSTVQFNIAASDTSAKISKLQLISNKNNVIEELQVLNSDEVIWNPIYNIKNIYSWFVIKVLYENGLQGVSSPIFIHCFGDLD